MKKILGIAILVTVMACNQAEKKADVKKDLVEKSEVAVSSLKLKDDKLTRIFNAYIVLKNALVKSDLELAKKAAFSLNESLVGYKGCESTAVLAKKIADDNSLINQRKDFTAINTDLITVFKTAALTEGVIYVQHCPMANKGDGGDWLSSEKEIRNPYYGDEMLECGRVVEEIKKK